MSADNVIYIQKIGSEYHVWETSASIEDPKPGGRSHEKYENVCEARAYAFGLLQGFDIVEYGVQHLPDKEKS